MNPMAIQQFDVLIIGSGLAGQSLALRLADSRRVALVTKKTLTDSASAWAQGGIAAVLDPADSVDAHIDDTFIAGAGLCDPAATRFVVEHGREAIEWLIARGVPFTPDDSPLGFHLTREGGHGQRRIIHAADATGTAVQQTLTGQVKNHPNITVLEHHIAVDLITAAKLGLPRNRCLGAYVLDIARDRVLTLGASHTALATGGAGKVYLYTTNPDTATGDGVAMAWRAGCRVANMEFIQFHPTCLYHPHAKSFLISEALRGEGGLLRLPDGTRFMPDHDSRAELAPRDIVARAIDFEMKRHGLDCVFLDMTHKSADFLKDHFPDHPCPLPATGHRHHAASRSRWFRPRTTPAAAWSPIWRHAPTWRGCMRSAKPPSPACTAPTAWRPIRCSNAWCFPPRRAATSSRRRSSPCRICRNGTKAG